MADQALEVRPILNTIEECIVEGDSPGRVQELHNDVVTIVVSKGNTYIYSVQGQLCKIWRVENSLIRRIDARNYSLRDICDDLPMGDIDIDDAIDDICSRHERDIELLAMKINKPVSDIRAMTEQWRASRREVNRKTNLSLDHSDLKDVVKNNVADNADNPLVLNPWAKRKGNDKLLDPPAYIRKYYAKEISQRRLTKAIIARDPGLKTQLRQWQKDNPDKPLGFDFVTPAELRDRDEIEKLGEEVGKKVSLHRRVARESARRRSGAAPAKPKRRPNRPKNKPAAKGRQNAIFDQN